jgi:hypothetical protein
MTLIAAIVFSVFVVTLFALFAKQVYKSTKDSES